jgi:hypothetical protein
MGLDLHDSVYDTATWPTPPESIDDSDDDIQHVSFASLPVKGQADPKGVAATQQVRHTFDNFKSYRIAAKWEGAFNAGRYFKANKKDLPPKPISPRELNHHPLRD